jgi:DNA polymerase
MASYPSPGWRLDEGSALVNNDNARLWHALGLGPLWRVRAVPDASADGAPAAGAASDLDGSALAGTDTLDWDGLERAVAACTACALCETRTQTVFGVGQQSARWMFVGEAPGAEEDARGEPFVGQAGRLLDNMLAAAGLGRDRAGDEGVFIANVLKCRPPGNRNPEPQEVARCAPFLQRQIALLKPRIIVVMGKFATQALLATDATIASLRGRVHELRIAEGGATLRIPVIVTYHPAYLLRNLADKAKSWDDLLLARDTFAQAAAA